MHPYHYLRPVRTMQGHHHGSLPDWAVRFLIALLVGEMETQARNPLKTTKTLGTAKRRIRVPTRLPFLWFFLFFMWKRWLLRWQRESYGTLLTSPSTKAKFWLSNIRISRPRFNGHRAETGRSGFCTFLPSNTADVSPRLRV